MLYDNTSTTVKGQWIKDNMSMTELSKNYNRTANNITMAMPHSGIVAAARDPLNGIAQPHDANVSTGTCLALSSIKRLLMSDVQPL